MSASEGVSFFEPDICRSLAQGISGGREFGGSRYRSRLARFASRHGFRNLPEFPRFHVVDIAVYRDVIGNQWVVSDTHDILDDTLRIVGECQPVDIAHLHTPTPLARLPRTS